MTCAIPLPSGEPCPGEVEPGAPISLCVRHMLTAYDWISRDVGVTDTLPSPCLACGSRVGVRYPSGWICALCEWRVGDIPDAGAADARVDVVYYIRYRDQVKIGTSGNPRGRLASLPWDEVLAFERGDRTLEQRRHAQFAAFRIPRTEWFHVHDALLEHIAEVAAGSPDPWLRYNAWVSSAIALRR